MELIVGISNFRYSLVNVETGEPNNCKYISKFTFKAKLPLSTCKSDNYFSIHTTGIYAITDNGDNTIIYA